MLPKAGLLRFLVDLAAVNDTDLLQDDSLLPAEVCAPADRERVREAADIVLFLRREFSYPASPEFQDLLAGKSEQYATMQARLVSEPIRRAELRRRLDEALCSLTSSDLAFQLLPLPVHESLERLRELLQGAANPPS